MACNCTKLTPDAITRAKNALAAAARVGKAMLASEVVLVSPEVKSDRMAVCVTCDQMKVSHNGIAHFCTNCGCWLDGNVLCKACLATETCPIGKWG